jgi:hypothetical protein
MRLLPLPFDSVFTSTSWCGIRERCARSTGVRGTQPLSKNEKTVVRLGHDATEFGVDDSLEILMQSGANIVGECSVTRVCAEQREEFGWGAGDREREAVLLDSRKEPARRDLGGRVVVGSVRCERRKLREVRCNVLVHTTDRSQRGSAVSVT